MEKRSALVITGLVITIAAVLVLNVSGQKTEVAKTSKPVGQLVGIEPLPMAGEMGEICYLPTPSASVAGASASLLAVQQAPAAAAPQGRVPGVPSTALQTQIANRRPARVLDDAYPSYSAVAI